MSKQTSLVVTFDHDTKKFFYDEDSTDAWIRELFYPPSCTYSTAAADYVGDAHFIGLIIRDLNKILENQEEIL